MSANRLQSLDALRGLTVAAMLLVNNPGDWSAVFPLLLHAQWHGFTPTDLIFPLFLFVVGVSLAVRRDSAVDQAVAAPAVGSRRVRAVDFRGTLWRGVRLIALGVVLNLAVHVAFDTAHFRIPGVLQRIGLCVVAVGAIAAYAKARTRWLLLGALLLVHSALLALGDSLEPEVNIASRFDAAVFGPFAYVYDASSGRGHDPEGVLSTLGAIATTLLGLLAATLLRRGAVRQLFAFSAALLIAGWLWSLNLPLNKNLWTPSFVLWTGGWSTLLLATLHLLIDRRGWPALGASLGRNAILVYAGSIALVCALAAAGLLVPAYEVLFASLLVPLAGPQAASLAFAATHVALWWLVAKLLDRAQIHWKI